MSEKKNRKIENLLDELKLQCMLGNGGIRYQAMDSAKGLDYTQQVEQNDKFYEQKDRGQSMNAIMMLTQIMKNDHQDLKEAQKYIKNLRHLTDAHNSFGHDMKKGHKKHSKQINKLKEQVSGQKLELKKYRKQIKKQTKTLRALAVYLSLGTMSDDLGKIQQKCYKEISVQRSNSYELYKTKPPIIDGKCREVE